MAHGVAIDRRLAQGARVHIAEVAVRGVERCAYAVEGALDPVRRRFRTCAAIGRREDGPDALDRVEHGDVGHLVTAAQQGLAAPDMRIEPTQLVVAEVFEGVVTGEGVDAAPDEPVAGAADLVLGHDLNRSRVAFGTIALAVVGDLAHRVGVALQIGDTADHARDVPRHAGR